ncbi:MAG: hypothetical protein JWM32_3077 [Verrucomicrobia bacterium]|nr:hypothetical protein [Verrucomicrobiota bacterium]
MSAAFDLSSFYLQRAAESRSLSAENFAGAKGGGGRATLETSLNPGMAQCARDLGQGWKVSPCLAIPKGTTVTLMDHEGPGVVRHFWSTLEVGLHRHMILRIYWDGQALPSVEAPLGDFMCNAWGESQVVAALPINVNPKGGLNCFFPMPFRRHCRMTIENDSERDCTHFFYTINYTLEPVPDGALNFHAQFRRVNVVPEKEAYTIVDGIEGAGHYAGTFLAWEQRRAGWWGEGEVKMYLDGDREFPTICGTGTEDYFGGAWNFGATNFTAPFFGFHQVRGQSEQAGTRMTMYRFHLPDPVHFKRDLRITVQALGWRGGNDWRYLPLQDDLASVAYWYQTLTTAPFPALPDRAARAI